jgi:hypothetical protein
MHLPNRIFFTGVPGSRWSGIAQTLETIPGFNTSDRNSQREYTHNSYGGHVGAYFGPKMEFEDRLDADYIDSAWATQDGTKIIKSHNWAYKLNDVKLSFPNDWIMLVYRPDIASYTWWHEAGGFAIKYPSYKWYQNSSTMLHEINNQNRNILSFAYEHDATWKHFNANWIKDNFGYDLQLTKQHSDILVTIIK